MKLLIPYLIFNGNCREAMEHYADIFNGTVTKMQTVRDAPIDFPPGSDDRIFDSEINFGPLTIKASDSHPLKDQVIGENVSLFLTFGEREQQKKVYDKLVKGGKVHFPLTENSGLAMVVDRFEISWMLVYDP